MNIAIVFGLFFVGTLLYLNLKKKYKTYDTQYHTIYISDLKNAPDWLKQFDSIRLVKTTTTVHDKKGNDTQSKYDAHFETSKRTSLRWCNDFDDDDFGSM